MGEAQEIASAGRLQKRRRKLWEVLNSGFVIWFLTSVVVAAISYLISSAALNREKHEMQRRLKWEVYNIGLEFQYAFKKLAWTRFEYETAFGQHLQNPKPRLVDLKPFSFDRVTLLGAQKREGNSMPQKLKEHHTKAAEHHEHAAKHHRKAAEHHGAGKHEVAAHHAHAAHGHHLHATHHASEAAKRHVELHGSK